MENITFRSNYLQEEMVDNFTQYDLGSINFGNYDFGSVRYYQLKYQDVARPDIISQRLYGTTNYWWFIMWYNGVGDVWNDLRENMVIKYPSIDRVREGIKLYYKK